METSKNTSPEDALQGNSVREIMVNGRRIKAIANDFNAKLGNLLGGQDAMYGEDGVD